jgi:hypothetical protein
MRAWCVPIYVSKEKLVLELVAAREANVVWAVPTDEIVFTHHATAAVAPAIAFVPTAKG